MEDAFANNNSRHQTCLSSNKEIYFENNYGAKMNIWNT